MKVKIEDIKEGTGEAVKEGDHVVIHYTGWLEEPAGSGKPGKKFDSSVDRDQPFETPIGVGYVIKGWDQGLMGMKVGGKRTLHVPSSLAYGERQIGKFIKPHSNLIFHVELLEVRPRE